MTQIITAPGIGMPLPQFLYPSELYGAPVDVPANLIGLAAGDAVAIPAGSAQYLYDLGAYSVLQYLDPVMGVWRGFGTARTGILHIQSDGITRRVANLTGCPIAADVVAKGTLYTQATAQVVSTVGGSTWQPIIGGSLSVSTINNAGANYTVPPIVLIPGPAPASYNGYGGVPATAYASLTAGTVSGVTLSNIGAGYATAPTAVMVPSPYDPNVGSITNATITLILVAANQGGMMAALCTNNGAPLSTISALTLTPSGTAGTAATLTPQVLQTVLTSSIVAGGAGWGTGTAFAKVESVGGFSSATEGFTNPISDLVGLRVRPMNAIGTTNAGGTITAITINDSGLFLNVPTAGIAPGGSVPTTLASITFTTGGAPDTVFLQPL